MKLIEADGKKMLAAFGVRVPEGAWLACEDEHWPSLLASQPVFLKTQTLSGRRGKNGLVVRVDRPEAFSSTLQTIREKLGTVPCAGFLCEAVVPVLREWYVSMDVDRTSGSWRVNISSTGGTGVAEARSFSLEREGTLWPAPLESLRRPLSALVEKEDVLLVEMNPLGELVDGTLMALDAKIELDDAAAFRHPEWKAFHRLAPFARTFTERERAYQAFADSSGHRGTFGQYVELDGDIALILSGGGASLVALDALLAAGGRAANYCEMSGNSDPELVREGARIVLGRPGLRALWIAGSHANFTDIQATIMAVLQACEDVGWDKPIVIRRDGPQTGAAERESRVWAETRGIPLVFDRAQVTLEVSAQHVVQALQPSRV